MVEYMVTSVSSSLSYYEGFEVFVGLRPSKLDGDKTLHDACVNNKVIHVISHKEYEELLEAKHRLEDLEW